MEHKNVKTTSFFIPEKEEDISYSDAGSINIFESSELNPHGHAHNQHLKEVSKQTVASSISLCEYICMRPSVDRCMEG